MAAADRDRLPQAAADRDRLPRAAEPAQEVRAVSPGEDGRAEAVAAARGNVSRAGVVALQRLADNRATASVVQRQPEDEDVEAAAGMFQQAEHGAGAARGRGALRGLIGESRAFNKLRKQSGPLVMDKEIEETLASAQGSSAS